MACPEGTDIKICVVLDRLRSAHNTGNIFRIAEAVGADGIICCGYTPAPPHPKLEKTAMGADKLVPCRVFDFAVDAVKTLKDEGYTVVAVENTPSAEDAFSFIWPDKTALVMGNEALGIESEVLSLCDYAVELPMFGSKTSINVGNCAAVVLYCIAEQLRVRRRFGS